MDEQIPVTPVEGVEAELKSTATPEQIEAALKEVRGKSFSGRNPALGKMVNCPQHGFRHRKFEYNNVTGCEQVFTYSVKDKDGRLYEQFREEIVTDPDGVEGPNGEVPKKVTLVPDYRTAVPHDEKPTVKQIVGAAAFVKKRFKPHLSKTKLKFVERTRKVFVEEGFYLLDVKSDKYKELAPDVQALVGKDFEEDVQRARVIAARQIRKESRLDRRKYRRLRDQARRINLGLKLGRNLA